MDASVFRAPRGPKLLLGVLVVVAALTRLYHFQAPLLDRLYVKQIYEANHARNIARPPLNPLRASLDFLDEEGGPMELTEEVPLFNGLGRRQLPRLRRARVARTGLEPAGELGRDYSPLRPDAARVRRENRLDGRLPVRHDTAFDLLQPDRASRSVDDGVHAAVCQVLSALPR